MTFTVDAVEVAPDAAPELDVRVDAAADVAPAEEAAASGQATGALQSPKTLDVDLSFIPKTLGEKCRRLIETYHAMHGYACLPDMLWQPELRDIIEMHTEFRQIFKRASTARSAKRANEGFVLIATAILSLEVLASGFASWSTRFPAARRRADALLQQYTVSSRTWLMDRYLYPRSYINPAFINALAPPDNLQAAPRHAERRQG